MAEEAKQELQEESKENHSKDNVVVSGAPQSLGVILKTKETKKAPQEKKKLSNSFEAFAYEHFASRIPLFPGYREEFEQAGISQIYEAYIANALLGSALVSGVCFSFSLLVIGLLNHVPLWISAIGAIILAPTGFAVSLFAWLLYPIQKRKGMKQSLENRLAYSIGILDVLSSAGIGVEELFERVSVLQTNPVLATLCKRFLRNIKVFGMDTASALREVSDHCPSTEFSKLLRSIEVAFQTRGSLHDLISFESQRLFAEKRDKLRKSSSDLSVMAELYISLVVVMPIFFVVMFVIFQLLPKVATLPPATLMTNLVIFIGVPVVSAVFVIILDSMVQST